jgi:hypothetical protein
LLQNFDGAERIKDGVISPALPCEFADTTKVSLPILPHALPVVSARCGLWLHGDDLMPEIGTLASLRPIAIAAVTSECVALPIAAAIDDALARCVAHYRCAAEKISLDGFITWVKANQLTEVIAYAPFLGPEYDTLLRISEQLKLLGIPLTLLRRESDAIAFSFSSAGFFPFWKKMSRHLLQTQSS